MTSRLGTISTVAIAAAALAAGLTGCSSSDDTSSSSSTTTTVATSTPSVAATPSDVASTTPSAVASSTPSTAPSSTPSAAASTPTAAPTPIAGGTTIKGTGYSYQVPAGWKDTSKQMKGRSGTDSGAVNAKGATTMPYALNVLPMNMPGLTSMPGAHAELIKQAKAASTKAERFENPKVLSDGTLGGEKAFRHTADMTSGKTKTTVEQYVVSHGSKSYIVSLSGDRGTTPAEFDKVFGPILASWTWK